MAPVHTFFFPPSSRSLQASVSCQENKHIPPCERGLTFTQTALTHPFFHHPCLSLLLPPPYPGPKAAGSQQQICMPFFFFLHLSGCGFTVVGNPVAATPARARLTDPGAGDGAIHRWLGFGGVWQGQPVMDTHIPLGQPQDRKLRKHDQWCAVDFSLFCFGFDPIKTEKIHPLSVSLPLT